jgi:hypothetical protein
MPTWQFDCNLNPDHSVPIPADIAAKLRPDDRVHVVLVAGDSVDELNWQRLAAEQFLDGYAPGDDIYDQIRSR